MGLINIDKSGIIQKMSEYRKDHQDPMLADTATELSDSFVNGEVTPINVDFLQTEASLNTGDPQHLERMATDEEYMRHHLRGQIAALEGRFFITKKAGSYTTDAMDLMVMLAYSRRDLTKQSPEAHLYELSDEDLRQSLSLVERIREEYYQDQIDTYGESEAVKHQSKTYIGIAGGKEASIARVHWHVYDLSDYQTVGVKDIMTQDFSPDEGNPDLKFADLPRRLGWEADQSLANRKLVEQLSQHIDGVRYHKFSARFYLSGKLSDASNAEILRIVSEVSHQQSQEFFGEQSGYTIVIDSDNEVTVRITKTKQGIVESVDHLLYRRRSNASKPVWGSEERDARLGRIIGNVILQGVIEE